MRENKTPTGNHCPHLPAQLENQSHHVAGERDSLTLVVVYGALSHPLPHSEPHDTLGGGFRSQARCRDGGWSAGGCRGDVSRGIVLPGVALRVAKGRRAGYSRPGKCCSRWQVEMPTGPRLAPERARWAGWNSRALSALRRIEISYALHLSSYWNKQSNSRQAYGNTSQQTPLPRRWRRPCRARVACQCHLAVLLQSVVTRQKWGTNATRSPKVMF